MNGQRSRRDTRGVEWLSYSDRVEARAMPLPRSLANLKQEISEKKWAEACQWAGGRTSKTKYRMPKSQRPDGTVAGSTKRLASRFYQIKTGHCLSGQYLHWTKNRPTPQCWWCRYQQQTREHLFKVCREWKAQQKILWAEVRKETGRWKSQWKIRDLLADGRCSRAVLDFLTATDVGRRVLAEESAGSEASERELRERREWEEEREAEAEARVLRTRAPGRNLRCSSPHPRSWHRQARTRGRVTLFFCSFFCPFLCNFPWGASTLCWDRPGRRAKGSLQRAATTRTADGKNG